MTNLRLGKALGIIFYAGVGATKCIYQSHNCHRAKKHGSRNRMAIRAECAAISARRRRGRK